MQTTGIVLLLTLIAVSHCQFLPQRLRIVDSNKQRNNFLVRGNLPIHHQQFQFEQLKQHLTKITGLKRYKLIVISFMNHLTPKQTKNRYIQEKFFQNNKKAQYRSRAVLGSFIDPNGYPEWLARGLWSVGQAINFDGIEDLLTQLREQIHGQASNQIVYVHCSAGVDRTGYVSGAYKMKYNDASLSEVMVENMDVLKGHRKYMIFNAQNGIQWYCFSLGRTQKECKVSYN